jgi:hypothetical protein
MYSQFQVVENVAFAVGDNQQIFKSVNAGESWNTVAIPMAASDQVRRLYFYSENIGFVDGITHLFRTTDGGVHWESSTLPFGSMNIFHSYNEYESFNMEAVLEYEGGEFPQFKGTVAERTTDGGQSWQTSEISETLMLGITVFPTRELGYSFSGKDFHTIRKR